MLSKNRALLGRVLPLAVAIALLLPLGCGQKKSDVVTVSGKVTFGGEAIESGKIRFESADRAGRPAETVIENGEYSVEVAPGEKIVLIDGYKPGPPSEQGFPSSVPFLPAAYNSGSKINRTIAPEGDQVLDFALTASGELPPGGP